MRGRNWSTARLRRGGGSSYLWSTGATTSSITVATSGSYRVRVTDGNGCPSLESGPVNVTVGPQPEIAASAGPALEGGQLNLKGSAVGIPPGGQAVVDWGDGSAEQTVGLGADGGFSAAHVFADDGSYTVRLGTASPLGCSAESTVTAVVANAAPAISSLSARLEPALVTDTITATATFSDAGALDAHVAEWSWGDGTTTVAPVSPGTIQSAHTYATPGVYTVTLRVFDDDGASATRSFEFVVVYDPSGGFVTGGGWISSPAGAYAADPSLTGKASYGFVSKYQSGADVPTGSTEFQFKVALLNFKSTSYAWLVVAGARAQFKGTGTINGAGGYEFLLTAVDGQVNGGGGSDRFRIKIWSETSGVVYDNMMGAGEGSDPSTVIGGGSIVIHKP